MAERKKEFSWEEKLEKKVAELEKKIEKMGKEAVTVMDFPGFLVNRVLCPMLNEACYALESGIPQRRISIKR